MKKFQLILVLILLNGVVYSQNDLKIGDKAPQINVTDYILNTPKDKSLKNKFIVLEFWATWCAPCLSEVPHLNELQNNFKNRKDLIFLSLTYEKPEKTTRTLQKILFNTVVVSDQSKKTESNFQVKGFPHTVLIDNKGIIIWIGQPDNLTNSVMNSFLNGQNIIPANNELIRTVQNVQNISKTETTELEKITDVALGFIKNSTNQFTFSLLKSEKNGLSVTMEMLMRGRYVLFNNNLKSIISKITKKAESQILISKDLLVDNYDLIYKNVNKIDINNHQKIILDNLLNALNLKEYVELKSTEIYTLKVTDAKKLNISLSQDEANHNGDNDSHFVFSNSKMSTFIKKISDYHQIIIIDETGVNKNLDFILRKGNYIDLNKDLAEYGLSLDKQVKELEFNVYK